MERPGFFGRTIGHTAVRAIIALAVGFPLSSPAPAWQDAGHMVATQIALEQLSPEARREVDRLVAALAAPSAGRASATSASATSAALAAAVWADDLKRQGIETFSSWHYINLPFNAGHLAEVAAPREDNIVWAIGEAIATLEGDAEDLPKALMLRFLLHFVVDVHQPLHCVNRFTAEHAQGDRGGNDFPLRGRHRDLHAYWDTGAGVLPEGGSREVRPRVRGLATEITRRVPKSAVPEWRVSEPARWAAESHDLAVRAVYHGIEEGAEPSAEYAERAREVVRRRLALAGYRLGALLNEIYGVGVAGAAVAGE